MGTILFIIGIILFIALVVVHELGHAIAAKRNGVVVEEFGIGFPPKAWGKKLKNGVLFTLNWLPLGGFVKLKGESDDATGKGAYGAASLWAKTKILMAGVVVNWLTAVVLLTILAVTGLPKLVEGQFTVPGDTTTVRNPIVAQQVSKDSPASKAGLRDGDQIIKLNGQDVTSAAGLITTTKQNAGKQVSLTYRQNGQEKTNNVTLRPATANGQLGVVPFEQTYYRSTWSAPIVGVGLTAQFTGLTFQGLGSAIGNLFSGLFSKLSSSEQVREQGGKSLETAGNSVAGPVGIVNLLKQVANLMGLSGVILIIAIISLTLAVMNVLPIPALDGGRLFVTLLYRAMKKPLKKETEEKIHATGFMALMGLFVLITFLDITKLVGR